MILPIPDHDLTAEENAYIIYPVSYRLQDLRSSFGPLGMVALGFVQEEHGPLVLPEILGPWESD
jgi:hypothetical protein